MSERLDEIQSVDLRRYWVALRRRWPIIVAGLLLGILAAAAYLVAIPRTVTATAVVRINVISQAPFNNVKSESGLIDPNTEVQLARSSPVLVAAAKTIGGGVTARSLRANLSVSLPPSTTVVDVAYSAKSASAARAAADVIANDYLAYRSMSAAQEISTVEAQLTSRRNALRNQLITANMKIASTSTGTRSRVQAVSERQLLTIELNSLLTQLNQFRGIDTTGGSVITGAQANGVTVSPGTRTLLAAGGLLGLLLGLVVATTVNVLDRRLYDARSVADAGGGLQLSRLGGQRGEIPATGDDLDAIRSLRERLLVTVPPEGVLTVIDLTTHRESSDIGVNLALAFAEIEPSVCLVLPEQPEFVGDVVGALNLVPSAQEPGTYTSWLRDGLHVLVPASADRAGGEVHLGQILAKRERPFSITIISLPPTAARSHRLTAARLGHSVLLVANRLGTRGGAVAQVATELEAVEAVVHGTVLVPRRRRLRPRHETPTDPESDAVGMVGAEPRAES